MNRSFCLLLLLLTGTLHAQTIKIDKDSRSIAVTASADASAQADIATVHIGFISYGPDQPTAYAKGSALSNAIAKSLADAGVKKDAIESDAQNIAPVQTYETEKWSADQKAQRQYKVTQSWSVHTSAADAARILDVAVKAGANESGQIDWSLQDENALQAQAAGKALERAQQIAAQMATGLHIRLGALLYASNQVPAGDARPLPMMAAINGRALKEVQPLAISSRKVQLSATVYAVFAIE